MRMSLLRSCRSGIGGSDIAAVFGLSRWKSRYQLYLEKTSVRNLRPPLSRPVPRRPATGRRNRNGSSPMRISGRREKNC